jgi:hypothetical protein
MAGGKRSIAFEASVLRAAEEPAGGDPSAFVNAAVLRGLRLARGRERLAQDDAALGPVRAQVAEQWPA